MGSIDCSCEFGEPNARKIYTVPVRTDVQEVTRGMAVSRDRGRTGSRVLGGISRYDLLLGVIPVLFVLAFAVSVSGLLSLEVALATAGLASAVCLADAFYLHPPVGAS